jgi:serine protease AprX
MVAAILASALSLVTILTLQSAAGASGVSGASGTWPSHSTPALSELAASSPDKRVEVIVQLQPGVDVAAGRALVTSTGANVSRELPIINGLVTTLPAAEAELLGHDPAVRAVSVNAAVRSQGGEFDPHTATSFNQSIRSDEAWDEGYTGRGIGVAVVDTGIAGDLPDFRVSRTDATSRVIASVVTNPGATTATDSYGHGTHIAGLIAGDGTSRQKGDPLRNRYVGVAPDANLISVKVADEQGNATVLDVIDGLQFVVDHKADYNIRVVNLSLRSTTPESYTTDPLDAAVEAAWNSGIVVVVAAGNSGTADDAVSYAPANDPYVITVGGVDDMDTKSTYDDELAAWSSRGTTQDGFAKPDVVAPGARLISTIPPNAAYTSLCPSCVVDGSYFRVGGTSMAAAVASGAVADLLQARPSMTPNQVKDQLVRYTRAIGKPGPVTALVNALGLRVDSDSGTISGGEIAVDKAIERRQAPASLNNSLTPNLLIDPATGLIDYTRASWSRASWSEAIDPLRASWSRASWSRASWSRASWSANPESCSEFERASWSRASWSRASWSRASWSRASWSADGMTSPDLSAEDVAAMDAEIASAKDDCARLLAAADPTRASWSRASWSRASWSTSFTK